MASLGVFASGRGQSQTFSVFVTPIGRDRGISSATVTTAYGLAALAAAFLQRQMDRFADRFGARRMLLAIVALLGMACLFFSTLVQQPQQSRWPGKAPRGAAQSDQN